jgi:hypothetical protein
MSRIDKDFYNSAWESLYDKPALQALSSSTSEHCPLLLAPFIAPPPPSQNKIQVQILLGPYPKIQRCGARILEQRNPSEPNHMLNLHVKLSRVAKDLRVRFKKLIPHARLAMAICREAIF